MTNEKISLQLDRRDVIGKKVRALRRDGNIPAVIYGQGFDPVAAVGTQQKVEKAYRAAGRHHPIQLTVDGKRHLVMIKSIDMDPVKHKLRHVAFHAVKQNEKVEADIPVVLVGEGESAAEKVGLVVLQAI